MSKNKTAISVSKLVAIACAVIACVWVGSGALIAKETEPSDVQAQEKPLPLVQTVFSKAKNKTRYVTVFGTTEHLRTVQLKAQTAGEIEEIVVQEGDAINKGNIIARIAVEDRKARLQQAKSLVKQRELEYTAAKALFKSGNRAETQLAGAKTLLDEARANLAATQLDIEYTEIRSPFDGLVEHLHVEQGDLVRAREDNVAMIVDSSSYLAVGYVPEHQIMHVEKGLPATVELVDGHKAVGLVRYVSHVADAQTRTFKVEIEVTPEANQVVNGGQTAHISIPVENVSAHLVKSSYFTLNEEGDIGIKTLAEDGTVMFHTISIIDDSQDGVWVTGLPDNSSVISLGHAFVKVGDKASPENG